MKYDEMLDSEFGESASELREKMEEISVLVQRQENPSKIQVLSGDIKNLAMGVGGSLIASGMLSLAPTVMLRISLYPSVVTPRTT